MNNKKKYMSGAFDILMIALLFLVFVGTYIIVERWNAYEIVPASFDEKDVDATVVEEEAPYITQIRIIKEIDGEYVILDCFDNSLGKCELDPKHLSEKDRLSLKEGVVFSSGDDLNNFLASQNS